MDKLCKDCKYYVQGAAEDDDLCHHPKAQSGGVRQYSYYKCSSMRVGICSEGKLWEAKVMP